MIHRSGNKYQMINILKRISNRTSSLIAVCILSLVGIAVTSYSSANGSWGSQDSVEYIVTARNLIQGDGFGYPLTSSTFYLNTFKAPLYSVVLSGIGLFRVDLVDAARFLNILLFAITTIMVGLTFINFSSNPGLSIPAVLLFAIFPITVKFYSSSLSEPLFLCLLVINVYCLLNYLKSLSMGWLVSSAVLASLLPMVRYMGIVFIPVGAASVLVFLSGSWKERIKKTFIYSVIASLPFLIWEAWLYFAIDHSFAGRMLQLDWSIMVERIKTFSWSVLRFIFAWIPFARSALDLQLRYLLVLFLLLTTLVILITALAVQQLKKTAVSLKMICELQISAIYGLWSFTYLAIFFIDWLINLNAERVTNRLLLPVYVGFVLGLMGSFACWQTAWLRASKGWIKVLPWGFTLLGMFWYVPQTINEIILPLHNGQGATANYWRTSETMAAVRALPGELQIASNDAPAVLLWADRPAYVIMVDPSQLQFVTLTTIGFYTGANSSTFIRDNEIALDAFHKQGVAFVLFSTGTDNNIYQQLNENGFGRLKALLGSLTLYSNYSDGVIYIFNPK
jgi:hypothetical protein